VNNGEDGLRASRTTGWTSSDFPLVLEQQWAVDSEEACNNAWFVFHDIN